MGNCGYMLTFLSCLMLQPWGVAGHMPMKLQSFIMLSSLCVVDPCRLNPWWVYRPAILGKAWSRCATRWWRHFEDAIRKMFLTFVFPVFIYLNDILVNLELPFWKVFATESLITLVLSLWPWELNEITASVFGCFLSFNFVLRLWCSKSRYLRN